MWFGVSILGWTRGGCWDEAWWVCKDRVGLLGPVQLHKEGSPNRMGGGLAPGLLHVSNALPAPEILKGLGPCTSLRDKSIARNLVPSCQPAKEDPSNK